MEMSEYKKIEELFEEIWRQFINLLDAIVITLLIMFTVLLVSILILYVFKSVALFRMAKNRKEKYYRLSWIPFVNDCVLTKMALDNYIIGCLIPLGYVGFFCVTNYCIFLNVVGYLLMTIALLVKLYSCYKIYIMYSSKYKVMLVFSVFTLGLITPFLLYAIRNNKAADH